MASRLLVIGLDCVPPWLVFDQFAHAMPTLRRLRARGIHGALRSVVPPITVPAWACASTGRTPGELGVWGFRNRANGAYELDTATSDSIREPHVWDRARQAGLSAARLFVPPSFPLGPERTGILEAACMLTPGPTSRWANPPTLEAHLTSTLGPYLPDLDPRLRDDDAFDALHAMVAQHFAIAEHVLTTASPDLLFMVEIATDRLLHLFHTCLHPQDPRRAGALERTARIASRTRDFLAEIDRRIGRLLAASGPETNILVVSDHGARPLEGGVRINEWLRQRGFLVLRNPSHDGTVRPEHVDFAKTRAWSDGGYYARIFLNVQGREASGVVAVDTREAVLDELELELRAIPDPTARGHRVVRPSAEEVERGAPDLLVFFGDLALRALGSVGPGAIVVDAEAVERDRGRGGCNHDWDGILVAAGPGIGARGELHGASLLDVAPTILDLLRLEPDPRHGGRSLTRGNR